MRILFWKINLYKYLFIWDYNYINKNPLILLILHNMNKKNLYTCTNCGRKGHNFKVCKDPITSLGIILIKFQNNLSGYNLDLGLNHGSNHKISIHMNAIRARNNDDIMLFSKINQNITFLMIRRKHTLGYIEFIRGRYRPDNLDGIIFLFQQMTQDEINKLGKFTFDELWNEFWGGVGGDKKNSYEQEYQQSKNYFTKLKNNETELGLSFFINNVIPSWNEPEWGFPKGRRNKNERDIDCAKREFEEETSMNSQDYEILDNIEPLIEDLVGTNGISYRHIYYVAVSKNNNISCLNFVMILLMTKL